jgi:F-type H+-transporting ATPase subunit delta
MKIARTKHFARSLVEIGNESNCFSELIADLESVEEKLDSNLEFKMYLNDKQVTFKQKKQALEHIFKDFVSKRTYNFIYILIKANKLNYLAVILVQANKLNLETSNVIEVLVESVIPLAPKQEKEIQKIIEDKIKQEIVVRSRVNEEILAGLRIRIGDTLIEGSLYGKIVRLKDKIEKFE